MSHIQPSFVATLAAAAAIQVVPVIDLQAGLVVCAVGGRRHEYRPLTSQLVDSPAPAKVAAALAALGFRTLYVADLDAIAGAEPSWAIVEQLMGCGAELWLDAGISDSSRAQRLAQFNRLRAAGWHHRRARIVARMGTAVVARPIVE